MEFLGPGDTTVAKPLAFEIVNDDAFHVSDSPAGLFTGDRSSLSRVLYETRVLELPRESDSFIRRNISLREERNVCRDFANVHVCAIPKCF